MGRTWIGLGLSVLVAASTASAADVQLETDEQKTMYALGLTLSQNLIPFDLTAEEYTIVQEGLADGVLGREPKVDPDTYRTKFRELAAARQERTAAKEQEKGKTYLAKAAEETGAVKTDSGLIYKEISAGTGPSPTPSDRVKVHYHGTLTDGTVFDSSRDRGQPATFPLGGVIKCWTEGVQKMKVGGKAQLVCPPEIAYGTRGAPPTIKPGATLVFEVELLEIAPPAPAPTPGTSTPE
jgi:FKBP-type peptidyl-prolyl cis-trans isomerase FkpA